MAHSLKYKCLVMDHDDTVVNSTVSIHYPAFVEFMARRFPEKNIYTAEDYVSRIFDPGVIPFFRDEIGMSEQDMLDEQSNWVHFVKNHIPDAYPGIAEILHRHKEAGGILCVVSHSFSANILRDYRENGLPAPDMVFGWESPPEEKKPSPFPLRKIMDTYKLTPADLLVVDDLKPGYDMARACGVTFAAVGWSNNVAHIQAFMQQNCDVYLRSVADLHRYLFD